MSDRPPALAEFPVVIREPVLWNDMDAYGHVNNCVYFRYFESGRIAYFGEIGFDMDPAQPGAGPILAATDCRFRLPLRHPDTIDIGARVGEIGRDRFTMHYAVYSRRHERIAAEGSSRVVVLDYRTHTKTDLPEAVRARIERLEKR